jgi:hypothetical protein
MAKNPAFAHKIFYMAGCGKLYTVVTGAGLTRPAFIDVKIGKNPCNVEQILYSWNGREALRKGKYFISKLKKRKKQIQK